MNYCLTGYIHRMLVLCKILRTEVRIIYKVWPNREIVRSRDMKDVVTNSNMRISLFRLNLVLNDFVFLYQLWIWMQDIFSCRDMMWNFKKDNWVKHCKNEKKAGVNFFNVSKLHMWCKYVGERVLPCCGKSLYIKRAWGSVSHTATTSRYLFFVNS